MNVADQISETARIYPGKESVVAVKRGNPTSGYQYESLNFKEFDELINRYANTLKARGVKKGDKALLFVRPCLDFSALAFALFKAGAVPVFIDPGMGRKPFLKAIVESKPKVLIGIPKALALKALFKKSFMSVELSFSFSNFGFLGAPSIKKLAKDQSPEFTSVSFNKDEMAAILFTSGGTGAPKGVVYTHDIFINQTKALQKEFNLNQRDVDVPGFPLFALFTLSMGMKSVIPPMDPSKPSKANPSALARVIKDHEATFLAGSPAIWKNLADNPHEGGFPSVRCLVMFGAPVPCSLHRSLKKLLPNGDTFAPYGATESLPVSNNSGKEVLARKALVEGGKGVFIGKELPMVKTKIIERTEKNIKSIEEVCELPDGEVGEIVVASPTTTRSYYNLPEKTAEAKIAGDKGEVWHRMGDVGYKDAEGNLWFCGRKSHVVEAGDRNLYTAQIEAFYNNHPGVFRSALISKNGAPAIVIQRKDGRTSLNGKERTFLRELKALAAGGVAEGIEDFYLIKVLPVDIRHNIKIDRLRLRDMVSEKLEAK